MTQTFSNRPRTRVHSQEKLYDINNTHVYRSLRLELDHNYDLHSRCALAGGRKVSDMANILWKQSKKNYDFAVISSENELSSLLPSRDYNRKLSPPTGGFFLAPAGQRWDFTEKYYIEINIVCNLSV